MKKWFVVVLAFIIGTAAGLAAPIAQHLIDGTPGEGILINPEQFFKTNPAKNPVQFDEIFRSPRTVVNLSRIKGPFIGKHIHTETDEIIYVLKGKGEVFLNGQWVPMKAGDLHICPRGVAHTTRAVDSEGFEALTIFTKPVTNDKVMLE